MRIKQVLISAISSALLCTLLLVGSAAIAALEQANESPSATAHKVESTTATVESTGIPPTEVPSPTLTHTIPPRKTDVRATRAPNLKTPQALVTRNTASLTPTGGKILATATAEPVQFESSQPISQAIPSEPTIYGEGKHLVAIDVGHGGIDEGTYPLEDHGSIDYHESQINLAIAFRLRDILVSNGIRVYLDRIGDYYLNPDWLDTNGDGLNDLGDEQQVRVDLINATGAELLLSLHINASTYADGTINPNRNGSTTYYCDARPFSDLSYRFASLVHQEVLDGLADYGYQSFDLGVLSDLEIDDYEPKLHLILLGPQTDRIARPSNMPAALDEPLFATNYIEARMLPLIEVQEVLAQAYARAIMQYFTELDGG